MYPIANTMAFVVLMPEWMVLPYRRLFDKADREEIFGAHGGGACKRIVTEKKEQKERSKVPQWTEDQQQVIDSREKNMLVSAAAGSGKTAVLVERIIQRILDEEKPIDVDRIVVVTFTKAAAAEMRERILLAINGKLEEDPGNVHLMRQATLVHNAQITTIDSFCNYIVRNHFHEIDLEPDYRIGDEGEMLLMRRSVMDAMMQKEYDAAEEAGQDTFFYSFMNAYVRGNSDQAVTDMILRLFDKAQSYPWPKEWLQSLVDAYEVTSTQDLQESAWFAFYWTDYAYRWRRQRLRPSV